MMMYNRKRRNEFLTLQKQLKEDSLEAARLAYMTGTASDEQIVLVEDATAKAKQAGITLPSILSVPQTAAPASGRDSTTTTAEAERTVWAGESLTENSMSDAEPQKKGGITSWLFSGLKKEDTTTRDDTETLSSSDERWRATASSSASTADASGALRDTAKAAFEQEKSNQRRGGPLDQVGVDRTTTTTEVKKKGWLW
jgi:hypothetical protein